MGAVRFTLATSQRAARSGRLTLSMNWWRAELGSSLITGACVGG
jgi:hypothetical protein